MQLGTTLCSILLLLPLSLIASEIPLGGIGFRYDGSGHYDNCKPPTSADIKTGKGVRWKIPTANWSWSQPVEVGDQVLIMCEPGTAEMTWPTLVSYDKKTGKEQWRTAIDPLLGQGITGSKNKELTEQWALFNEHYRYIYRNASKFASANKEQRAAINKTLSERNVFIKNYKAGYGLLRYVEDKYEPAQKALKALKEYHVRPTTWQKFGFARVGVTFTSPVSNGEYIFTQTLYGTVGCLNMDGSINWIKSTGSAQLGNKGQGASPRIVGDIGLSCQNGLTVAWDLKTGKEKWRVGEIKSVTGHGYYGSGDVLELNGEVYFIDQAFRVLRVKDGKVISKALGSPKYASISVDDDKDRFFMSFGKGEKSIIWSGYEIVGEGDDVSVEQLWEHTPGLGYVSPTYHKGNIYHSGTVINPDTGLAIRGGERKNKQATMPRMRGNAGPNSKHLVLVANNHLYGMQEMHIKDKAKRKTGPFFSQLEVYTTDSKKVSNIFIPYETKDDPNAFKVWEQGILNDKKNPDYVWPYSHTISIGSDCLYVRTPTYLYSLAN